MNLRVQGDADAAGSRTTHSRKPRAGEGSGLLVARELRAVTVISDEMEKSARVPSPLQPLWEAPGQWLCLLIAWSRLPQGM